MKSETIFRICPATMKFVAAGVGTAAIAAVGANAVAPVSPIVSAAVIPLAAINPSNQTIGFADSDLYGKSPAVVDAALDQMQALGVNNVRVLIPWAAVQPKETSAYDWSATDYVVNAADARGMGVLGILNSTPAWAVDTANGGKYLSGAPASPTAYGLFAGATAKHYKGKVGGYEIWNEPNAITFFTPRPDPVAYTGLLKAAYSRIRTADPKAQVIGGVFGAVVDTRDPRDTSKYIALSPTTFVKGIYAAGGKGYFNALSYHPYQYNKPFSQGIYPTSPLKQLESVRQLMVDNGDSAKKIWASEYGEPTSVVSEATQASYIKDFVNTYRGLSYTGPTFVYTLQDRNSASTVDQDTLGVIRSDGTWKAAAYTIKQLATQQTKAGAMARLALARPDAATMASPETAAMVRQALAAAGITQRSTATTPAAAASVALADAVQTATTMAATGLDAVSHLAAATLRRAGAAMAPSETADVHWAARSGAEMRAMATKESTALEKSEKPGKPATGAKPPTSSSTSTTGVRGSFADRVKARVSQRQQQATERRLSHAKVAKTARAEHRAAAAAQRAKHAQRHSG